MGNHQIGGEGVEKRSSEVCRVQEVWILCGFTSYYGQPYRSEDFRSLASGLFPQSPLELGYINEQDISIISEVIVLA